MCFQDIHRWTFFGVPEGNTSVLITSDDLSSMISPKDNSLFLITLSIAYSPTCFLFSWVSNVKYCDVAIDVRGH